MSHTQQTTRERRRERTRQDIINAATTLIAQEGAESMSLREIARRIDYSPAGLYEYFDSKEALVEAVCNENNRRLLMYLRAVSPDLPPDTYLVELSLAYIAFARANRELFTLVFTRFPITSLDLSGFDDLSDDDSFSLLYRGVERAMQAGIFSAECPIFEIAYILWAQAHGMAMLQANYIGASNFDYATADRRGIEALIRGLKTS